MASFAPDEKLPSSATLYSPNIDLKTCYENAPHLDHWGAIKTIIQIEHAFNPSKLKLLPNFEHSQFKHTYINPKYTPLVGICGFQNNDVKHVSFHI